MGLSLIRFINFSGKNGGGIWGALRGGIVCFPDTSNPENFKCYDTRDGLQDEYIHALMEDGNGMYGLVQIKEFLVIMRGARNYTIMVIVMEFLWEVFRMQLYV